MPKQLLNEAELFLLGRWGEARRIEESMGELRTKYKVVFERIIDAVSERHPLLDASVAYPTQFWGIGTIGFGRKSWPGGESRWPSGLWVENLRIEIIGDDDAEPPYASLWFSTKAKSKLDSDAARVALNAAAKDLLSPEELEATSEGSGPDLLYLPAPSKSELLNALSEGDGQTFVERLVSQFDMMARFVPMLDKVFRDCFTRERASDSA